MKNHFKLKREEAGMNPVTGPAIRQHAIKTPTITSIAQAKGNRGQAKIFSKAFTGLHFQCYFYISQNYKNKFPLTNFKSYNILYDDS